MHPAFPNWHVPARVLIQTPRGNLRSASSSFYGRPNRRRVFGLSDHSVLWLSREPLRPKRDWFPTSALIAEHQERAPRGERECPLPPSVQRPFVPQAPARSAP